MQLTSYNHKLSQSNNHSQHIKYINKMNNNCNYQQNPNNFGQFVYLVKNTQNQGNSNGGKRN